MALSAQTKVSVAVGFAAIAALIVGGVIGSKQLVSSNGGRRMVLHWQADGGDVPPDGGIVCIQQTGVGMPDALAAFGLDAGAGQYGYAICRVCAPQLDAGTTTSALPSGIIPLETTQVEVAFDGGPQMWCALQGEPEFQCACSKTTVDAGLLSLQINVGTLVSLGLGATLNFGSNCFQVPTDGGLLWNYAPSGTVLRPGTWDGGSCYPVSCTELSGYPAFPTGVCPQ